MQKWTYEAILVEFEDVARPETAKWLNDVGARGFELVSTNVKGNLLAFIFKKPAES